MICHSLAMPFSKSHHFLYARARECALMTRKSCAIGIRRLNQFSRNAFTDCNFPFFVSVISKLTEQFKIVCLPENLNY